MHAPSPLAENANSSRAFPLNKRNKLCDSPSGSTLRLSGTPLLISRITLVFPSLSARVVKGSDHALRIPGPPERFNLDDRCASSPHTHSRLQRSSLCTKLSFHPDKRRFKRSTRPASSLLPSPSELDETPALALQSILPIRTLVVPPDVDYSYICPFCAGAGPSNWCAAGFSHCVPLAADDVHPTIHRSLPHEHVLDWCPSRCRVISARNTASIGRSWHCAGRRTSFRSSALSASLLPAKLASSIPRCLTGR